MGRWGGRMRAAPHPALNLTPRPPAREGPMRIRHRSCSVTIARLAPGLRARGGRTSGLTRRRGGRGGRGGTGGFRAETRSPPRPVIPRKARGGHDARIPSRQARLAVLPARSFGRRQGVDVPDRTARRLPQDDRGFCCCHHSSDMAWLRLHVWPSPSAGSPLCLSARRSSLTRWWARRVVSGWRKRGARRSTKSTAVGRSIRCPAET